MSSCRVLRLTAVVALALSLGATGWAAGGSPTDDEQTALNGLKGKLIGLIVWESNRTGYWELFVMNADGTGARQLTHLGDTARTAYQAYMRPQVSPDGKSIMFGYGQHDNAVEAWIVSLKGNDAHKVCDGLPLNWSADGKTIYVLRDSLVVAHVLASGEESLVSDVKAPTEGRAGSTVGSIHPSLKSVALRTPRANEYFVFAEGKTIKTTGGCEVRLTADGRYMYWVQGPKDFRVWDMEADTEQQMLGTPAVEPYNYTYFPTVSADNRWLMYGASPGQHDHSTSDYEVYLQELDNWSPKGTPIRLTWNTATDRWPYLWLAPRGAKNPLPAGPYDVASNRATNPPPPPLTIFTFAAQDAGPEFGGEWGLWPQQEDCRGEATFVSEDAEGGQGGSIKVDYTIKAEPHSFSLWITSGDGAVDLTAYDRFVLYVRGTVPTLTLVVKDQTAVDPDAPRGIAEFVLKGVKPEWQRFEAPFAAFRPREKGGRIDWRAINHLGLAMIAPQNAASGTFWVDNLRAEAAP
ncbi:MAG: hypothetical protein HPY69_12365 [Armatimonadetes bacterium]|nr:hypothetical protein [Armatimonadota bacterium]